MTNISRLPRTNLPEVQIQTKVSAEKLKSQELVWGKNHPRLRLTKLFFFALVFLLPIQTRKVFFTDFSFFQDFHVFYNTLFLYLTDFLICGLVLFWFWENVVSLAHTNGDTQNISREKSDLTTFIRITMKRPLERVSKDPVYLFMVAFWLTLAVSLIFSRENILGAYSFVKISLFLLLFAYIRENLTFSAEKSRRINFNTIVWILLVAAVFQSLIGISQYLTQSSLGLGMLGEEFLRPGIKGIAKFVSSGTANPIVFEALPNLNVISESTLSMRAYGTFPHPNVLAAFLFFSIVLNIYLIYFSRKKLPASISLIVLCTGMVVTFSRLAWLATFFAILIWICVIFFRFRKNQFELMQRGGLGRSGGGESYKPQRLALLIGTLVVSLFLNLFLFGGQIRSRIAGEEIQNISTSETYLDRKTYGNVAWNMFKTNPIFGVGLRNFVIEMDKYTATKLLPYQHQPVHNIYFLLLAEVGIFGLLSFVLLLLSIMRSVFVRFSSVAQAPKDRLADSRPSEKGDSTIIRETLLLIFFGFLFFGFFDHYFLTIQQGSLIFWFALGMPANFNKKPA